MNNTCEFCHKQFKSLRTHRFKPPKYCIVIRDALHCSGCNKNVKGESLASHQEKCELFIAIKSRQSLEHQLEIAKNAYTRDLEFYEKRNKILEAKLDRAHKEFTHTLEIKQTEYNSLLKQHDLKISVKVL